VVMYFRTKRCRLSPVQAATHRRSAPGPGDVAGRNCGWLENSQSVRADVFTRVDAPDRWAHGSLAHSTWLLGTN
jgi:hypothetical protein